MIRSVSDGYHSVQLYFGSIIFGIRVMAGYTRAGSVSHDSVEGQLFELSG